jgi:uncharacterized protein (DUF58 family)
MESPQSVPAEVGAPDLRERLIRWWQELPLTREGLFWGAIALGILITGLLKGINLITLLACLLLVMLLWNYLLARRQFGQVYARRLEGEPPFAGTLWHWRVFLSNHGRRTAYGLSVQADDDPRLRRFHAELPANGDAVVGAPVVFASRGRVHEGALQLVCGYPLGLVQLSRLAGPSRELIVLPQLGTLHRGALRALLHAPGADDRLPPAKGERHPAAQTFFHGLRNYRPGDSPRLIHWRTSARRGEPMVREFEDPPEDDLTLVVEAYRSGDDAAPLERLISLAATICWEWCRQRGDRFVLLLAGTAVQVVTGITGPALAQHMLECLALEEGTPQPDTAELLLQLRKRHLPSGPVLVLTLPERHVAAQVREVVARSVVALTACSEQEESLFQLS